MISEGGKEILGRVKTKALMTNKEELKDGITPLKSMQGIKCCISTSLSIISFLSFLSISSFLLNSTSGLTLFFFSLFSFCFLLPFLNLSSFSLNF